MINLKKDTEDSFSEYKAAVERKKESADKDVLTSIEKPMEDCYINYAHHFEQNDLEFMPQAKVGAENKDVLLGMFSSQASIVRNFRKRFFAQNPQTYNNLCSYCTLNEANTTEHILPKEKYPEFSVDTLNLIPACSVCNSKKGDNILDKIGKKCTINFYTDILPETQYLFVDFQIVGTEIKATYRLDNHNNIDPELYSLIKRHFNQFDLLERFDLKALHELSELINLYLAEEITNVDEFYKFAKKQIRKVNMDSLQFGYNHWKVILYLSAAQNELFKNYILNRCKQK